MREQPESPLSTPPAGEPAESAPVFLTAEWRSLLLINFAVDATVLHPHLPRGTEPDLFEGRAFVSLVGFRFLRTRVKGIRAFFHQSFEEVNLRFYVRCTGTDRRGVVFTRELVPRRLVAWVARSCYNENYHTVPMHHADSLDPETGGEVAYGWRFQNRDYLLQGAARGPASPPPRAGSHAHFIMAQEWGYTRSRDGGTTEYQVEHPPWPFRTVDSPVHQGDWAALYGREFSAALAEAPVSAYLVAGSEVNVRQGIQVSF